MQLRSTCLSELKTAVFDTLVIGGGINGAVTAAALSARGARTALIDARDFAGGSSQQSSNLAWGGIKYMETFEFGLVNQLCASRNHLIRSFPSSVQEMRFFTVHEKDFRHSLLKLFAGTWLYWLIGRGFTRTPRLLSVAQVRAEEPVVKLDRCDGGFEYSDAYLVDNDARFVFQFVRSAMDAGCAAVNYVESEGATRGADGLWSVQACDRVSRERFVIRARTLVNACGAFVDHHNARSGQRTEHHHVLSKGIHLIVRRITDSRRILTFFADDGRLFFAIPMGDKTCIGTTDTRVDHATPHVTEEDRRFVLDNINKRLNLAEPLTTADIISERCGVRPLVVKGSGKGTADWLQMSRKHVVESRPQDGHVSIFGGKLTDCLNVGEELCAEIERMGVTLPQGRRRWYGEPQATRRTDFLRQCEALGIDAAAPVAGDRTSERLWRLYGEEAFGLLEEIRTDRRAAEVLVEGSGYMRCEFAYCARREMITTLEDFLRRRSKLELTLGRRALRAAPGLMEACRLLFGSQAQLQYDAYFAVTPSSAGSTLAPLAMAA
ncbi:glycerol-3-phosphate dehydrogenase/oxidase [Eleftheria terrae]|uniref:glycerol-3-phosphate dehydrogenase/oxidase n=1 Tax=Eleftheria terrae TaxID=1597781 RepID=UPI00263AAF6D|nr:glycerol-3-phosphate dehydrogenase/oxidase [Eleftheria terrae]WKB53481.1 glycerol-3-phosphate dehydrogenase/oxidase [Eleftheria terrae]